MVHGRRRLPGTLLPFALLAGLGQPAHPAQEVPHPAVRVFRHLPVEFGAEIKLGAVTAPARGFVKSTAGAIVPPCDPMSDPGCTDLTPFLDNGAGALATQHSFAAPILVEGRMFAWACVGASPVVQLGGDCSALTQMTLPQLSSDPDPSLDFIFAPLWQPRLGTAPGAGVDPGSDLASIRLRETPPVLEIQWTRLFHLDAIPPDTLMGRPTVRLQLDLSATNVTDLVEFVFDDEVALPTIADAASQLRLIGPDSTYTLCENVAPGACPDLADPGSVTSWRPFDSVPPDHVQFGVRPAAGGPATVAGSDPVAPYTLSFDPAAAGIPGGTYVPLARSCPSSGCLAETWTQAEQPMQIVHNTAPSVDLRVFVENQGQFVDELPPGAPVSGTLQLHSMQSDPDTAWAGSTGLSIVPEILDGTATPPPWPPGETFAPVPALDGDGCWAAGGAGARAGFACDPVLAPETTRVIVGTTAIEVDPATMTEGVPQLLGSPPDTVTVRYRFLRRDPATANALLLHFDYAGPTPDEVSLELVRHLHTGGAALTQDREVPYLADGFGNTSVRSTAALSSSGDPTVIQYLISSQERDHRRVAQETDPNGAVRLSVELGSLPAVYVALATDLVQPGNEDFAAIDAWVAQLLVPTGTIPGTRVVDLDLETSTDGGATHAPLQSVPLPPASVVAPWNTVSEPPVVFQAAARAQADDGLALSTAQATFSVDNSALRDDDDDGFTANQDCDDSNPSTHPGATEVNDGLDNQCPGETGYGLVDELDGLGFHDALDASEISWTAQPGATDYEVARSGAPDHSTGCVVFGTSGLSALIDPDLPGTGERFHYLARAVAPNAGSWGAVADGERLLVCP